MRFVKKFVKNVIKQRELRAARETARWLIAHNDDFRGYSEIDLTNAISNDKKPVSLSEIGL